MWVLALVGSAALGPALWVHGDCQGVAVQRIRHVLGLAGLGLLVLGWMCGGCATGAAVLVLVLRALSASRVLHAGRLLFVGSRRGGFGALDFVRRAVFGPLRIGPSIWCRCLYRGRGGYGWAALRWKLWR